jgi:hypothetical protein
MERIKQTNQKYILLYLAKNAQQIKYHYERNMKPDSTEGWKK